MTESCKTALCFNGHISHAGGTIHLALSLNSSVHNGSSSVAGADPKWENRLTQWNDDPEFLEENNLLNMVQRKILNV